MLALLPLLSGPAGRFGLCAAADLVSVHRPCGDEWSGVAGPPNGSPRSAVPTPGQLLSVDRGLGRRARTSGWAIADRLAGVAGAAVAAGQPRGGPRGRLPDAVLLVDGRRRMGQRSGVPVGGGVGGNGAAGVLPRLVGLCQWRWHAVFWTGRGDGKRAARRG